jgi:hypothetical protein
MEGDATEATLSNAGTVLAPLDLVQLSSFQLVLYKFGMFVVELLERRGSHAPVTLLLASALPRTRSASRLLFFLIAS